MRVLRIIAQGPSLTRKKKNLASSKCEAVCCRADPFSTLSKIVSRNVAGAPLLIVQVRVAFADMII